ncbi:MAG: septum formation protein Maf [Clostridia bacterium]|nr:septum formation protein Maf [Clostridia bacterium]
MKIILASKSPRRKELLSALFPEFDILTAEVDETLPEGLHPREGVAMLAVRKGEPIATVHPDALVISSDTLVELDGVALGKPTSEKNAREMLSALSGNTHRVHTGVAVHYRGKCLFGTATTSVIFRTLSEKEISDYVATGEPMDKAGAYGIQGLGGALVDSYDGDFDTVVGLSMTLLKRLCEEITND